MAATGTASPAHQRRSSSWLGLGLVLYGTAIFAVLTGDSLALAKHMSVSSDLDRDDAGICQSVDIRNSLESFEKLEGCRVVEGFVQILLFDNVNETLLSHLSFPLLTEITDYLLLYRVNGLRSIGQLFPNLAVIRGQITFFNYAFVVFEMSSLQEIGLYSLTDISHGLIRIDKNPSLCFLNSINWDLIAPESGHFIKSLKPENECPICPGDETAEDEDANVFKCPKAPTTGVEGSYRNKHLCWNRQHCQRICPAECKRSCNANGQCCDSSCLGGCAINNTNACTVCKHLSTGTGPNRRCISNCHTDYYKFLERRCVTHKQCTNMAKPIDPHSRSDSAYPYKIHEKSCVRHCPTDYMGDNNHTCIPCKGGCKKKCPGGNVDNIGLAKQLRGCTHIEGSLEIQIRGGRNVVNELEENLSMIEEIQGYLKVVRSFPLVSLNFLKSLKRIKGDHLDSQKYAFVVLDNQNLQDLWEWDNNRTISIENGSLFFHFNPKLCMDKILTLQRKAGLANFTDLEVATSSNGDKIACDVQPLEVIVTKTSSKGAILSWKQFEMTDPRKLLGYIVYLIEAPHKNITMYDGRDACGGDGWRLDDVTNVEAVVIHPLLQLKPYTQYAFYVKTYTIAKEKKGAQSDIKYFSTQPSVPTGPSRLEVHSNASDTLRVTWKHPSRPNGNVTHYYVSGTKQLTRALNDQIDYCTTSPKRDNKPSTPSTQPNAANNDTCPCDEKKPATTSFDDIEESNRIKFEDDLQNEVYVKRAKREAPRDNYNTFPNNNFNQMHNTDSSIVQNRTEPGTDIWESFNFTTSQTEFYITNLHHFTHYEILVQACRAREGPEDTENHCSSPSMHIERTLAKKDADDIKSVHITNQSSEVVSITWEDPPDPNGEIYSYSIQYKRVDNENSKPSGDCITRNTFVKQNRVHQIKNLLPGNYSLRVCATSAAGFENYSPYIYFHIEESTKVSALVITIIVLVIVVIAVLGYVYYRKNKADRESIRLIPSVNPEYVPSVYVADDWEVPRRNIELLRELGQGSFGMVYEGIARDVQGKAQIKCAVKTVNEHATNRERLEFLNEASVMKAFDTAHVVRLLGVVSEGQPTLVIMELMANGDLKSYLRSHRPETEPAGAASTSARQPPTLRQILQMAIEIADGMAYLSAKKFVHRDLAARNCMVTDDLTVKIGDFGMTRDIYETDYYRKGTKGLLPVRWMAPESLKDGVFSSSSDVWSYGVVLWEMATLASQPYQGLSNDQVLRYVINGGIMERPENCPDKLYSLMRKCWNHKAIARPSFLQLCYALIDDASPTFPEVSFYHSPAGIEARNYRPTPSSSQDDPSTPLRMPGEIDARFSVSDDDSDDDDDDDMDDDDDDTHIPFPTSIPIESKDGIANGYVSGCNTKSDAATTQC